MTYLYVGVGSIGVLALVLIAFVWRQGWREGMEHPPRDP
jgi:hypothetical protein